MDSRIGLFVGLAVAILSAGCGTVTNTLSCAINPPCREFTRPEDFGDYPCCGPLWWVTKDDQNRVYGGVRDDWVIIENMRISLPHDDIDPFWAILDMPFSAIGDTITLPYILAYRYGLFRSAKENTANPRPELP
jgi:uncharacterized protein YceK